MMKLVSPLMMISLFLGTCFTTRVESREKKTISNKQLEAWINQLSKGDFRERRTALNNLLKAGKQALPFLEKGAQRNDAELSTRCFYIIVKMYRGKNETLYSAAEKALNKLEKSSNRSIAEKAKNETKISDWLIILPSRISKAQMQALWIKERPDILNGNWNKTILENGKTISIKKKNGVIPIEVTETINGKLQTKKYKSKNDSELKKKHPDLFKLYKKHDRLQNAVIPILKPIQNKKIIKNLNVEIQKVKIQSKKSKEKKSSTAKRVSEKQLEAWVNQLSEGSFRERRSASSNLLKAGKQALPFLVKGAQRNDAELAKRCFDIIAKMYRGKNKALSSTAKIALGELEKSSNKSLAQRAKNTIQKKSREDAIAMIEKLGGRITYNESGHLESVRLVETTVTDADMVHLRSMANMKNLNLRDTQVTDACLMHLKGLTSLTYLNLSSTMVTGSGFMHLKGLPNLDHLFLQGSPVTDAGLIHLKRMTCLRCLLLYDTKVTGVGLIHLKGLTNLQSLLLSGTKISDASLVHLKGLTGLEVLSLDGTKITNAGLVHLKGLTNLNYLYLNNTQITDAGLVHLRRLTNLTNLNLTHTQVTGAGLVNLKGMSKLEWLELNDIKVTGDDLVHLKGLTNLGNLHLDNTEVSDSGLVHLGGISSLWTLYLNGTQVTDVGLMHLEGLTKLESLYLKDTKVTEAGVKELKVALPKCFIYRK